MEYNADMTSQSLSLAVSPLQKRKRVPMRVIRAIAQHIARRFDPEKIVLFGSYAYGRPDSWSDVDLLVVMDTPKGELETALTILKSLPSHSFSIDIVARSQSTIEKRKALGDWFLREITAKGKLLYERNY